MAVRTQKTCRTCPRVPLRINLGAKDLPPTPSPVPGNSSSNDASPVISPDPTAAKATYPPTSAESWALLKTAHSFRSNATTWAIADAIHKATEPITCPCSQCACIPSPMKWTLCIPVPAPNDANSPTLREVFCMVGYSTAHGGGSEAYIQTDVLVTTAILRCGVFSAGEDKALDSLYIKDYEEKLPKERGHTSAPPPPQMIDPVQGECFLTNFSTVAVKPDGGWSRHIDRTRCTPDVRVNDGAYTYLIMTVNEFPTAEFMRTLHVRVSAIWQRKEVEEEARAEAERKAREEREERERIEAEKRAREDEERRERRQARQEARTARREEHEERVANARFREEFMAMAKAILESRKGRSDSSGAGVTKVTVTVGRAETCPQGYKWKETETGFLCEGGSHKVDVTVPPK